MTAEGLGRAVWGATRTRRHSWGRRRAGASPRSCGRRCTRRCRSSRPGRAAAGPCRTTRNWVAARARRTWSSTDAMSAAVIPAWFRSHPAESPRPSVERRAAVGVVVGLPGGVVGAVVVERAEELAVGEVGPGRRSPRVAGVVGFAPGGGDGAARRRCTRWSRMAMALRWAGENDRAERPRSRTSPFAAEDDGDDPGLAGEPAGLFGGDPVTGRGGGGTEAGEQGVEVEGDHHDWSRCRRGRGGRCRGGSPGTPRTPHPVGRAIGSSSTVT